MSDDPLFQGEARKVEEKCRLQPSRYFYAGKAHPDFGNIVIAYNADFDHQKRGEANPFDTGGVFLGHIHPFKNLPPEKRAKKACAVIDRTKTDIKKWRSDFDQFVLDFFGDNTRSYLEHDLPTLPADSSWDEDLPVFDQENHRLPASNKTNNLFPREWRAWAWEIRLTSKNADPTNHVLFICFDATTLRAINDEINKLEKNSRNTQSKNVGITLNQLKKIRDLRNACNIALEDDIFQHANRKIVDYCLQENQQ